MGAEPPVKASDVKPERKAWESRIVGHEEAVAPDQLLANPRNWRIHPQRQQQALEAVLDKVGWIRNVIVNQRTGHVVDGHLRVSLAISKGDTVPVTYVDLTEAEERAMLVAHDPLAELAEIDHDAYDALIASGGAAAEELAQLFEDARSDSPPDAPGLIDETPGAPKQIEVVCPNCGAESGWTRGSGLVALETADG